MIRLGSGTLNLNGARDSKQRAMLYDLIKQKTIDVMMVQETSLCPENIVMFSMRMTG